MKKIISILLILTLTLMALISCGDNSDTGDKTSINVSVLSGTTGFGMAQLMEKNANSESKNSYNFSIVAEKADSIIAGLSNNSIDIAALPTNAASVVYNKTNGGVKILAINTLGVLYLLQTGDTIKSISDLEGKTIYAPPQNPTFILKYLLDKNNIIATIDSTYSPVDLRTNFVSGVLGEDAIVVLPEPMVTIAKNANKAISVALDLTEEWNKVCDTQLVQGCIVARTEFINENTEAVKLFLDEYEESIKFLQENVTEAAALVSKHKYLRTKM